MKKLLFVSSYASSFVKSDIAILEKHFQMQIPNLPGNRSVITLFKMAFKIFWGVFHNDLVFCWFADFAAFLAVKAASLFHKKVFVIVGGYEVSTLPGYGGLNGKKRKERLKYILINAAKVFTVSDFSKQEINALNLEIVPEKISIGVEQKNTDFPKSNLIITSGSATQGLYKLKGLDLFAAATKDLSGFQLEIIGPFDEEIKEQLLEINPRLQFTGKLTHEKFLEIMKSAKVYCQLSQRESFGLAVLEAMNLGCIPVVTNAGAMPEIVGKAGFICDYGEVESAKKAINKALKSDLKKEISAQIEKHFTIQLREEKLINLIERGL